MLRDIPGLHRMRHSGRSIRVRGPMITVGLLLLAACSGDDGTGTAAAAATDGATADPPTIVATTTVLGDITGELAGDAATVTTLMPPGADPHSHQPSARQVRELTEADLVVANGGLEGNIEDALAEAERSGVPVFHALDHTDTIGAGGGTPEAAHAEGSAHPEEDHAHDHGGQDPHVWLDPVRMVDVVHALGAEISTLGVEGAEARAATYAGGLEELDARIRDMLSSVPQDARSLVTNHDALAYFADRYDFEIVGTVVPGVSTGAEPSAQDLEELAQRVRDAGVGAIFLETTAPDALARTLAEEVGDIEVVQLYTGSLGAEGSGADSYVGMLETNAERVAAALSTT